MARIDRPLGTGVGALLSALFVWSLVGHGGVATAQEGGDQARQDAAPSVAELQLSLAETIAKAEQSVVAVSRAPQLQQPTTPRGAIPEPTFENPFFEDFSNRAAAQNHFQPTGSGVAIDNNLVVTQYLNVRVGDRHQVTTPGGEAYPATIKGADPRSGLAVLEVETDSLTPLPLGDADRLRKGHFVVTLGNPFALVAGDSATVGWGIVANLAQKAAPEMNLNNAHDETEQTYRTTLHHFGTLIQTDAKLGWSASGGALVNLEGELVGITTSAATIPGHEQAAGYAIPLNRPVRRAIQAMSEGREVEYGLLGVSLGDIASRFAPAQAEGDGAIVLSALSGSAAARAGLRPQDRVIEIEGEKIESATDLQLLVGGMPPGKTIQVRFVRGEQTLHTEVTLTKYHVPGVQVVTNAPPAWRGLHVDYATALPRDELTLAEQSGRIDPQGCVLVSKVEEGSPAWQAGVRSGRFISHVGSQRVSSPEEFREAVAAAEGTVDLRFTDQEGPEVDGVEADDQPRGI